MIFGWSKHIRTSNHKNLDPHDTRRQNVDGELFEFLDGAPKLPIPLGLEPINSKT